MSVIVVIQRELCYHVIGLSGSAPPVKRNRLYALQALRAVFSAGMEKRIRYILKVLAVKDNRTVILCAFGCGVFKNEADDVAHACACKMDWL